MNLNFRALRCLLFAAGLLLIAACGSDEPTELTAGQPGEGDSSAQEVEQDPDDNQPTPLDDDTPVEDEPPVESPNTSGYERVDARVDLLNPGSAMIDELVVDADGITVLVRYVNAAEPCSGARATAVETDTTIEITLETGLHPNAAAMSCIAQSFGYEIAVPLAAPVGSRELIAVPPAAAEPADEDPLAGAVFPTDQYLGLTEAEAIELGDVEQRVVRVARIDDEFFMLTEDFSPTRVNIEIENGIVVLATSG